MANNISEAAADTIERLTREGYTLGQIRRMTGIAKATVTRHRKLRGINDTNCPCGKPIRHPGFCFLRFARQPGRQAWMGKWHPKSLREIEEALDTSDVFYFG